MDFPRVVRAISHALRIPKWQARERLNQPGAVVAQAATESQRQALRLGLAQLGARLVSVRRKQVNYDVNASDLQNGDRNWLRRYLASRGITAGQGVSLGIAEALMREPSAKGVVVLAQPFQHYDLYLTEMPVLPQLRAALQNLAGFGPEEVQDMGEDVPLLLDRDLSWAEMQEATQAYSALGLQVAARSTSFDCRQVVIERVRDGAETLVALRQLGLFRRISVLPPLPFALPPMGRLPTLFALALLDQVMAVTHIRHCAGAAEI